eukprot:GHVU01111142.1.p2 GENE.GHVU01111142.1~~GHVU01111142.1.p2  ORF type:complete len:502 (-),score=92.80 GHVU01111142.1:342-1847(-)
MLARGASAAGSVAVRDAAILRVIGTHAVSGNSGIGKINSSISGSTRSICSGCNGGLPHSLGATVGSATSPLRIAPAGTASSPQETRRSTMSKSPTHKFSFYSHLQMAPPDPILGTAIAFKKDTSPNKVNLGIGAYRTEEGKPYIFPVVDKVQKQMIAEPTLDKEYAPIDGPAELKEPTQRLIFGPTSKSVKEGRICSAQCLSGTGGLRLAAEFVYTYLKTSKKVLIGRPTWANHPNIFKNAGWEVVDYKYWDTAKKAVDFEASKKALQDADNQSLVLLHTIAHNPTGDDFTLDQFREIADIMKKKNHIALLDTAYQGYASGDLDADAKAIRIFDLMNVPLVVTQSFAKNLGLYGERVGMVHFVCPSKQEAEVALSLLKMVIRPMYSSPPRWGADILKRIVTDEQNVNQWKRELKAVSDRVVKVRDDLQKGLVAKGTPGDWTHITRQIGMFSYTGLTETQCRRMIDHHHIYMLLNGRISMAGLNSKNLPYVVNAIDDCVRNA